MSLFGLNYYSFKDFKQICLEASDNVKRKGMNKHPHKNNYKKKLRGNKI